MPEIKVLPEWIKNQIAAGEVIERPASVVKELVENSMDAGATRISVEIRGGGVDLIRVVDNGCGMSRENALRSLERHATSKMETMDDLKHIRTMGFRGEAIPSIASICRFTLRTREAASLGGVSIRLDGGMNQTVEDAGLAPGTEILVEDLFFNIPVRRKFLKKPETEASKISETIQRIALGSPQVGFQLAIDGRRTLDLPPTRDELARIFGVFGKKVCDHLYECGLEGEVSVDGFVSSPDQARASQSGIFTYVNGRFVRDKVIQHALMAGYGTLLPHGRYPFALLRVNLPPALMDVNVHPTKSEVRFVRSQEVHSAVSRAVALTLRDTPWLEQSLPPREEPDIPTSRDSARDPGPEPRDSSPGSQAGGQVGYSPWHRPVKTRYDQASLLEHMLAAAEPSPESAGVSPRIDREQEPGGTAPRAYFSSMLYLGQFANCFLLFQKDDELIVLDQHAAHERVLFEKFSAEWNGKAPSRQGLLVPQVVDLPISLAPILAEKLPVLARLGLQVEPFGGTSFAIKAVPPELAHTDLAVMLEQVAETLSSTDADTPDRLDAAWHRIIATMACKAAIKAGDPLPREEVIALLKQMDETGLSTYCPHGRPVVARFTVDQVGRWFGRS